MSSYHEVKVAVNNSVIELFNAPYRLELRCTRVGGWELWANPEAGITEHAELIGGEFHKTPFALYTETECFCWSRWDRGASKDDVKVFDDFIQIGTEKYQVFHHLAGLEIIAPQHAHDMLMKHYKLTGGFFWSGITWTIHCTDRRENSTMYWTLPRYTVKE